MISFFSAALIAAVTLTGNPTGSVSVVMSTVKLEPDTVYGFTVNAQGKPEYAFFGCGPRCGKPNGISRSMKGIEEGVEWSYVTRTHTLKNPYTETIKAGCYQARGTMTFSNPRMVELRTEYARQGDLELGAGERIGGNTYFFATDFSGFGNNDCRPLVTVRNSEFKPKRWCVYSNTEIVFRHSLPNRRASAGKVVLECGWIASGAALVDVRGDETGEWRRLGKIDAVGRFEFSLPGSLAGAQDVYVRLQGDGGKGTGVQIYGYKTEIAFKGTPAGFCGYTRYYEKQSGKLFGEVKAHWLFDEDYGELLPGSGDGIALWRTSSARKVPRYRKAPTKKCRGLGIRTAANEAEAVQLVITPEKALKEVKVSLGTLVHSKAGVELPGIAFDILRVGYVPVDRPTDKIGCAALWPDPLPPQSKSVPCAVPARANQPFWIRVKPPANTPKGVYFGKIRIDYTREDGSYAEAEVPLTVEVFGFSMPDTYTSRSAFGHGDEIFSYHNAKRADERAAVRDGYFSLMGDSHISPYYPAGFQPLMCSFPGFKRGDDANKAVAVFNWEKFDRRIERSLKEYKFNSFCVPLAGLGKCDCIRRSRKVFHGFTPEEPEYEILMGKYLAGIEKHFKEKGWLDKAYMYCYDEPQERDYEYLMSGFALMEKYAPKLRRILTAEPKDKLIGGPNLWVPLTPSLRHANFERCRAAGDEVWVYVCDNPHAPYAGEFIDHPGTDMRVWLWQAWGEKASGILIWQSVLWNSKSVYPDPRRPQNPYLDAMSWRSTKGVRLGFGNGEGRFIYPPEECFVRGPSGEMTNELQTKKVVYAAPVSCMRLEMIRDGIEDFEYFTRLKKLDPGNALLKVPSDVYSALDDYTWNPEPLEKHRLKMAKEIERLEYARRSK